jgi:hypothetical protein
MREAVTTTMPDAARRLGQRRGCPVLNNGNNCAKAMELCVGTRRPIWCKEECMMD